MKAIGVVAAGVGLVAYAGIASPRREPRSHAIVSISVCSPAGTTPTASCDSGQDTAQIVVGPDGNPINESGVGAASDEHSSIFAPGKLGANPDYLFFVASGVSPHPDVGVAVLSGGYGPDGGGQWHLGISTGYGQYDRGPGPVFLAPTRQGKCPDVLPVPPAVLPDPANQDQTFDLNYAAAGSIVKDPSDRPGRLLMIYEGSNGCEGVTTGDKSHEGGYITTGVATSFDYGHTWPTYRGQPYGGSPNFDFVPLPSANDHQGPNLPFQAFGALTCLANDCATPPPLNYGRYAVLTPPLSLNDVMRAGHTLENTNIGDPEPSAFVDDASHGRSKFIYIVHGYLPDPPGTPNPIKLLTMARAELTGGDAPLDFKKWNGHAFIEKGIGGAEASILPEGQFVNCGDTTKQTQHSGEIDYVDETQQYILFFICNSPSDPRGKGDPGQGSAWFYSTSDDVSDPSHWTPAQEVEGSWRPWDTSGKCPSYPGWYPSLMSLDHHPGRLSTRGYAFYLNGCLGGSQNNDAPPRQYSSRAFLIATSDGPDRVRPIDQRRR